MNTSTKFAEIVFRRQTYVLKKNKDRRKCQLCHDKSVISFIQNKTRSNQIFNVQNNQFHRPLSRTTEKKYTSCFVNIIKF